MAQIKSRFKIKDPCKFYNGDKVHFGFIIDIQLECINAGQAPYVVVQDKTGKNFNIALKNIRFPSESLQQPYTNFKQV